MLAEWAAAQLGLPLVWGETDCGALAVAALRRFGVTVPVPAYQSLREAIIAWRALPAWPALGATRISWAYARPGDIVWRTRAALPALYTIVGRDGLSSSVAGGVALFPLAALMACDVTVWRFA